MIAVNCDPAKVRRAMAEILRRSTIGSEATAQQTLRR
jgi:hypothetical protein